MRRFYLSLSLLSIAFLALSAFSLVAQPTTTLELRDSDGNLITGGSAEYFQGSWMDATDNGDGTFSFQTTLTNVSVRMRYNAGSEQRNNITSGSTETFNTVSVTVRLETCDDNTGLENGEVTQAGPGTSGSFIAFGTTETDGNTKSVEMLPGSNYTIRMRYKGKPLTRGSVTIPSGAASYTETFQATKVTLDVDGDVEYFAQSWKTFTEPMEYLLPGTYPFRFPAFGFQGNDYVIPTDCDFEPVVVVFTLLQSSGVGAVDGYGEFNNGSGWQTSVHQTNSNGELVAWFDGPASGTSELRMKLPVGGDGYMSTSRSKFQDVLSDPIITFQLIKARFFATNGNVVITDSEGGDPNAMIRLFDTDWRMLGTLGNDGELEVEMFREVIQVQLYKYNFSSLDRFHSLATSQDVSLLVRFKPVRLLDDVSGNGIPGGEVFVFFEGNPEFIGITAADGYVNKALPYTSTKVRMEYSPPGGGFFARTKFRDFSQGRAGFRFTGNNLKLQSDPDYAYGPWELMPAFDEYRLEPDHFLEAGGTLDRVNEPFGGADITSLAPDFSGFSVYPNPVGYEATINFSVPQQENVQIAVFDVGGKLVEVLLDSPLGEGSHQVNWQVQNRNKGVYLIQVITGETVQTKRVVVNR